MVTLYRYLNVFQMSLSIDGITKWSKSLIEISQEIKMIKDTQPAETEVSQEVAKQKHQLDDIFQLLTSIQSISFTVEETSTTIQRWDKHWQDEESQRTYAWLSPIRPWLKHEDTLRKRTTGTCEWLFCEPAFQSWLIGNDRALWCPGIPGAGKTVMTSAIIDYLGQLFANENVGIAFIYCNHKEKSEQTAPRMIASLVQQLIQRHSEIPGPIRATYEQHKQKKTELAITESSRLLRSEVSNLSRTFIIVDAFDESEEHNQARVDLVDELQSLPSSASLLFTSRDILSIKSELDQCQRIDIRATDADMKVFLACCIEKERKLKRIIKGDAILQQKMIDKIVESAKGMFLLAHMNILSLSQKNNRKAILELLGHLPNNINVMYDEALERIRAQNEDDLALAMSVFLWISCAYRPLEIIELQHAIAVEPESTFIDEDAITDEETLLSVCAGIVILDEESKTIRLVHFTAQEYLDHNFEQIFPKGQTQIIETYLTYLSLDAFAEGPRATPYETTVWLIHYPFLRYATQFWGQHAIEETKDGNQETALHAAIRGGQFATVQLLLNAGANFDAENDYHETPLVLATLYLHLPLVQLLIEKGASVDGHGGSHSSVPLLAAATGGNEACVTLLIKMEATIDACDGYGRTPLHLASVEGHEAIVKLLLEKGATIDMCDGEGLKPIYFASFKGQNAVVKLLIEKGATVNICNSGVNTPLHFAERTRDEAFVKMLIERGASIDACNSQGRTPLHLAVSNACEAIAKLLIQGGATIDACDSYGYTPLYLAITRGYEAMAQILVEKGANLEAGNTHNGCTPLYAAVCHRQEDVVRLLTERGANVEAININDGWTPLYVAAHEGHEAIVRLLVEHGAQIEAKDFVDGRTSLCAAVENYEEATAQVLVESKANLEAKDFLGRTPLFTAALNGNKALVKPLLEYGAEVDTKDPDGWTPLFMAALNGDETLVQILLEYGAEANSKDLDGWTPIYAAAYNGWEETVWLLANNGADVEIQDNQGLTPMSAATSQGREDIVQLLKSLAEQQKQ
ncbi:MAG: hypothetical protein M1814_003205 [Vezdaea aestivalis]|nr:MAG: hypothetical protein M1814_003205 [Vezdaea aestivalis]